MLLDKKSSKKKEDKKSEDKKKRKKSNKDLDEVVNEEPETDDAKPGQSNHKKSVSWVDEVKPSEKKREKKDLNKIFIETLPDDFLRSMITDKVNNKITKYKERISKEDKFFIEPKGKNDLSELMKKWRTELNKSDLKETLNFLYAKESKLIKRDLNRNIEIINENIQILGSSDGFKYVGKQLGFDNEKLITGRKNPVLTPNFMKQQKSLSYVQLKEMRTQEDEEKK